MALIDLTATALLSQMQSGEISSLEITEAFLEQIQQHDERVGAFVRANEDAARAQAREIDQRRAAGKSLGPLAGLPVAVKDVLCSQGELTTCASRMLANFRPPYDATSVARLKAAGAVLIGRTNMDEFAMGGSTENSAVRSTANPWDLARIPGGSSGGAAACVAARMAPLSLGSDTGGSIRQPAALCGVVGLKPTYGRVSRYGLIAFASSLDQVGPLAHTVEDVARLLEVIAGPDPCDSTCLDAVAPTYSASVAKPLAGLRLGVVAEHFGSGLDDEVAAAVRAAIDVYQGLGAEVREVELPHSKYAVATYYLVASSEASSNLARYDGVHYGHRTDEAAMLEELREQQRALQAAGDTRGLDALDSSLVRMYRRTRAEGFGPEVKRRIMLGAYALSAGYYDAYYLKALKVRRLIRQDFDQAFGEVDLIAGPVTSAPAYRLGEKVDDPLAMYLEDLFTASANLAGIAGLSMPCGFSSANLPIGLQLLAPPLGEETLLRGAAMYQQATDWHARKPNLE